MTGSNIFADAVDVIAERVRECNPRNEDDYIGDDGLLHCGKCGTNKQCQVTIFGSKRTVPCICECRKKEIAIEKEKEKALRSLENIEMLKRNSLMDDKFQSCSFDSIELTSDNKRQFVICKRYADKFDELYKKNQGLLLYGDVGTGKTHLACCIGNFLMERLHPVFATSLVKILHKAKSFKSSEDEDLYISKINEAHLLILDDLGAERDTDYALEIVYHIIDSRYRSGKPMIVTTNLSLQEMKRPTDIRYGRIYDRIFEVCYPVEFRGKSWRMKEAATRFDEMKKLLEG